MDKPYIYEIRIQGQLTDIWRDWFDGLVIFNEANGETTLSGPLPDQAALLGVLNKIHALNMSLVSILRSFPRDNGEG